ncbi:Fic family protein (plasmid) [Phyllobacterium sp. 628]|uniref:Fic family protein n=1 Tax=Phyllobacterium sp. 628 TaxID=2718938 RepID=UPI0016625DFD|nr:Fic family protein [Phyllobacterium sp. 628]QND50519.1 Fic family protein [Phyllobacterium sp. 628]
MQLDLHPVDYFQGELVPKDCELIGLAALVQGLGIRAPVRQPACVSAKYVGGSRRVEGSWTVYDKRYSTSGEAADHLSFALRHEPIDLLILKRAFEALPQADMVEFITATPTGAVARRVWFLYEYLTGQQLPIDDADNLAAVDVLDTELYFTGEALLSKRHRVRNNLLGTAAFCPVIRRTEALQSFIALDIARQARETIGRTGGHLVTRAASFMLLADSRASFAIEGERAPQSRLERWGRAVLEAGKRPLDQTEIYRLHRLLIGDDRFTEIGYRSDGVFLGERDHNNDPLPEFIGARPDDLTSLMDGLGQCNDRMRPSGLDPVLQAAAIAFGFVYIHPLADGNGRVHRCLIHHVLTERQFSPAGMVFPVSSVMLDRIDDYRTVLQGHSSPLMQDIDWKVTPDRNIEVTNDTADLYRYFDCTAEAEFLYACVQRTIEKDLPQEIDYLKRHDQALHAIMNAVEMPDRLAQDLIIYIRQNNGTLGRKRREGVFVKLTDAEITVIEGLVRDAFDGVEPVGPPLP